MLAGGSRRDKDNADLDWLGYEISEEVGRKASVINVLFLVGVTNAEIELLRTAEQGKWSHFSSLKKRLGSKKVLVCENGLWKYDRSVLETVAAGQALDCD